MATAIIKMTIPEKSIGRNLIAWMVCPVPPTPKKVLKLRARLQNLTEPTLQGLLVNWMETVLGAKFARLS
ncbi:MAG TPA: hypothetical protein DCQ32_00695 [Cyanobacteria bacterium UBA8156]|jgi:hypothetical protein|nr:hypothetical protein [Cyanobacteria bacterium UBA8156]